MKQSSHYTVWFVLIPVALAALFNYPLLQQTLQGLLPGSKTAAPTVVLPQATVVGKLVDDGNFPNAVEVFLGIPYALPPVGNLRFANPVSIATSNHTLHAIEYGPRYVRSHPHDGINSSGLDVLASNS